MHTYELKTQIKLCCYMLLIIIDLHIHMLLKQWTIYLDNLIVSQNLIYILTIRKVCTFNNYLMLFFFLCQNQIVFIFLNFWYDCKPFINTTTINKIFSHLHAVIFKLQERMLQECFLKSFALNFFSPSIFDFCSFPYTKGCMTLLFG